MSHIPQPEGSSNSETSFDGSLIRGESGKIEQIETTTPSTAEVGRAAGEDGQLPSYFYQHWRKVATIPWTTNDPIGKILWSTDVTPLGFDPTLAWQMRLWHAWGGDMEIMVRLVGTGFHAGQVACVSLPPRIYPNSVTNPLKYSIYPFEILDPKKLDPIMMTLRDRRNTKYHYLRHDGNDTTDADVGGHFAIYVDSPLNTSSTGLNRVNISIWAKCAQNFAPAFYRDPLVEIPKESPIAPDTLTDLLNSLGSVSNNMSASQNNANQLARMQSLKILTNYYANSVRLDGNLITIMQGEKWHNDSAWFQGAIFLTAGVDKLYWVQSTDGHIISGLSNISAVVPNGKTTYYCELKDRIWKERGGFPSLQVVPTPAPAADVAKCTVYFTSGTQTTIETSINNLKVDRQDETFVLFAGNYSSYAIQTQILAQAFRAKLFANILDDNMCFLYTIKTKRSGLPLFQVKLHPGGYFTALDTGKLALDNIRDLVWEPSGLIASDAPMVVNQQMAQNDEIRQSLYALKKHVKANSPTAKDQ